MAEKERSFRVVIDTYEGQDPIAPWLEYIKWKKTAYKAQGHQSHLEELLEQCILFVMKSPELKDQYRDDLRFLKVWISYADMLEDSRDHFAYLNSHRIGEGLL